MAEELAKEMEGMSASELARVREFIRFIKFEKGDKSSSKKKNKNKVPYDVFKQDSYHMADDFNETPDCFKEYV